MQTANNWRERLWIFARRKHPENEVLTRWLTVVRWVLFPLDTFFWHHHATHGYVWERDTWFMYGAKFSANDMRSLAKANGQTYTVTRIGDKIQFVLVEDYTAANQSLALEWAQHAYELEVERVKRQIKLETPTDQ